MMIFGMLYFDTNYQLNDEELIRQARVAYERKTGSKACIALLHMGTDAGLETLDGLKVFPSYLVRPHHTIVGIRLEENLQQRSAKAANQNNK
jgi:hypothetical protein